MHALRLAHSTIHTGMTGHCRMIELKEIREIHRGKSKDAKEGKLSKKGDLVFEIRTRTRSYFFQVTSNGGRGSRGREVVI